MPNNPLQPLVAPNLSAQHAVAPVVDWFQRIAPRLSAEAEHRRYLTEEQDSNSGLKRARFKQIEEMLWEEKQERLAALQEPDELVEMRNRALESAETLIAEAQIHAKQIQEEAYHKAYSEGKEQGYQSGYLTGYQEGEAQIRAEIQEQYAQEQALYRADIQKVLDYVEQERLKVWEQYEPQIVRMVSDMVRHIIKREIEENDTLVLTTIRNTLRRVVEGSSLRIRVHTDDIALVKEHREEILELLDGIRHLEIFEDRRVGRGGCIMETESGNIDARIETQMQTFGEVMDMVQNDLPEEGG